MSINVIVADGSHLEGEIICCLLESDPDIDVVGRVRNFSSLQRVLSQQRADVLVVDSLLPGMRTSPCLNALTEVTMPIIFLSRMTGRSAETISFTADSGIGCVLTKQISCAQEMAELRDALHQRIRETIREQRLMLEDMA